MKTKQLHNHETKERRREGMQTEEKALLCFTPRASLSSLESTKAPLVLQRLEEILKSWRNQKKKPKVGKRRTKRETKRRKNKKRSRKKKGEKDEERKTKRRKEKKEEY